MRIVSRVGVGKNPTSHHLDVTGSSNFDSQVFFQSTAFFNAGVELGDTTADLISVNGRIDTNVEPSVTLSNNFGSSGLFWNNTYSKNLIIKNDGSVESDGNILNLGSVSASTINIGTSAASTVNLGSTSGTFTVNNANVVFIGDLEIRGGDLTTNQTTFNLLNTTATTVNFAGAASTVNLGSTSTVIKVTGHAEIQALTLGHRSVSSATTITSSDQIVSATGSTSYTITLPTAVGVTGRQYTIKCDLSIGYYLTVATTSSQLIDSATTKVLTFGETLTVVSNGSKWLNINSPLHEGRGVVPLGAVIAIGHNSAWAPPASNSIKDGFALCDGGAYPSGSNASFSGNRPNLSDSRFLQGASSIGGTGGANSKTLSTSELPSHSHGMDHSHRFQHAHYGFTWSNGGHTHSIGMPNSSGIGQYKMVWNTATGNGNSTIGPYWWFDAGWIAGNWDDKDYVRIQAGYQNDHYHNTYDKGPYDSGNNIYNYENNSYNNWNTGGTRTSTDGAGSTTAFDIRPQFFNVIYVMRVV